MKRGEAIQRLKANRDAMYFPETIEALDMAINALAVYPQYKWERDIALAQLEEYGICFAEKKRDDLVEVVRCKDCYHAEDDTTHLFCVYFHNKVYEDDYCSNAVERKGGDDECV